MLQIYSWQLERTLDWMFSYFPVNLSEGKMSRNEFVMIILINHVILGFLLKVYCLCFLKCISAVTLLSISFSIASPGEQQSYSFYNNAGNNHIARGFSFTHCDENSLALVEKFEGFSLEFGLKTCKLPEATKHQNLQKLAQNFYIAPHCEVHKDKIIIAGVNCKCIKVY